VRNRTCRISKWSYVASSSDDDEAESSRGWDPKRQSGRNLERPRLGRCSGSTISRPPQQHLYLVLDDWERGYSIYRVGESDLNSDSSASRAEHPCSWSLAAMQPAESSPGIPVFDTPTTGVTVCPFPEDREGLIGSKPLFASVVGLPIPRRAWAGAATYRQVLVLDPRQTAGTVGVQPCQQLRLAPGRTYHFHVQ
jgi:hypothetical protein